MTKERRAKLNPLGKLFYFCGAMNSMEKVRMLHPVGFLAFIVCIPLAGIASMFSSQTIFEYLSGFSVRW